MAAKLPDIAPLEATTAGLEEALDRLEKALAGRSSVQKALAERLDRVIAEIEPLLTHPVDAIEKEMAEEA